MICALWIYPFLWLIGVSLKTNSEVYKGTLNLFTSHPQWHNYVHAWVQAHFGEYMLNTIVVTVGAVALAIIRSSMAGYVLGRYSFIGRKFLFGLLIVTFVVPQGYTIIPIVEISHTLHTLNSLLGIILVLGGTAQVANVLIFAGYFRQVPIEIEESARMDGAGFYTVFFRIILPIAKPIIATVGVLSFLYAWNAFFVPLVFTFSRPGLRTLPVGMMAFTGTHATDWTGLSSGAIISLLPVVLFFFFMQRYIVEGIAGAVKG